MNAAFKGEAVASNAVESSTLASWRGAAVVDYFKAGIDLSKAILETAGYRLVDGKLC